MFRWIKKTFSKKNITQNNKVNFKNPGLNAKIYWNLSCLFLKSFIYNFRNSFFTFILPVFLMLVFFFVLRKVYSDQTNLIKAGYILLAPMMTGITSLSTNLVEWKTSIFLKQLDATVIKKQLFLLTLICFYFIISLGATLWLLLWTIIVDPINTITFLPSVHWGYFMLGLFLFIFISITLGLFVGGISTSIGMAQALALVLYFSSMFLSGIMIPGYIIPSVRTVFNDLGYLFPHKFATTVTIYGWNINDSPYIYDSLKQPPFSLIQALGFPKLYIPIITSCVWPVIIFVFAKLTFKWEVQN